MLYSRFNEQIIKFFRRLPTAWDKDIKTSVGEANGPNVMTGYDDGATNFIIDSFCKLISIKKNKIDH